MTSKVTIEAHCASNKHVAVRLQETEEAATSYTVEDGEKLELTIYDLRSVTAHEVIKE
jgi:hypothetical protein